MLSMKYRMVASLCLWAVVCASSLHTTSRFARGLDAWMRERRSVVDETGMERRGEAGLSRPATRILDNDYEEI